MSISVLQLHADTQSHGRDEPLTTTDACTAVPTVPQASAPLRFLVEFSGKNEAETKAMVDWTVAAHEFLRLLAVVTVRRDQRLELR